MTQMLLFDSPSKSTEIASTMVASAPAETESQNIAAVIHHESGLNHMGDLARLVLLRYELVAKRRAAIAARKAAQNNLDHAR